MDYRLWEIVDVLSDSEYRTASVIGEQLGVSEKTVRSRIKELNEVLSDFDAVIASKQRYGYCLQISADDRWAEFLRTRGGQTGAVPADSKERVDYMLAVFLGREDYIKLEELSDFLYVSTKTLSNELKKVRYILNQFQITLERKPYYGIRAEGAEFNKRCCLLQYFYLPHGSVFGRQVESVEETGNIAEVLLQKAGADGVRFSEYAFQDTVFYLYISMSRMKKGMCVSRPDEDSCRDIEQEIEFARGLYESLAAEMEIPEAEISYTGIYIAGKRMAGEHLSGHANLVISERIDILVTRILDLIYETYRVEFREDLNLRLMLSQHLIPLEIRLKYRIPVEQDVLEEVKETYVFAYSMAQQAAAVISDYFACSMPERETACLALYFALAAEEKKTQTKRKQNVLLVCISGKASSQMLLYRFRKEFGEYIESLHVCGMYDFEQYDLQGIDIIFTTVPIYKKVSVPIMEIGDFLEQGEITAVRHVLQVGDFNFLQKFYKESYFFTGIRGKNKEEVIREICGRINAVTVLPDGFYDSVMERESFGPTDFGNLAAIPHPCRMMTEDTIVAAAILEEEIIWTSHRVRFVLLIALAQEQSEDTQKFYDVTTKFLMDRTAVELLLQKRTFRHFLQLLHISESRT